MLGYTEQRRQLGSQAINQQAVGWAAGGHTASRPVGQAAIHAGSQPVRKPTGKAATQTASLEASQAAG